MSKVTKAKRPTALGPRTRTAALASLACLAALGLTACGGSAGDSTKSNATTARVHHFEGGEKSVEEFGSEAAASGRQAIVSVEHAYLYAIAERDFARACALLSASVQRSLEQLVPKLRGEGCAAILPKLLASSAPAIVREQAEGEIRRVRVKGGRAFVIFHAPGAKLYVFTMVKEGGRWRPTAATASILVPQQVQ
jgi:hypothetical protein